MHSPIQLATVALFALSGVVSALPGGHTTTTTSPASPPGYGTTSTKPSPPGYGTTTTSSKSKSTCSLSTITSKSTGYTTWTTAKEVTVYVPSAVTKPWTSEKVKTIPYTSTITKYIPETTTKTVLVTKSTNKVGKSTTKVGVPHTIWSTYTTSVPVVKTHYSDKVIDVTTPCTTVVTEIKTSTGSHPSTIISTGASVTTKYETGASSYTTKAPSVSTSICTSSKPFTTTKYSTTSVCGPKGY